MSIDWMSDISNRKNTVYWALTNYKFSFIQGFKDIQHTTNPWYTTSGSQCQGPKIFNF